MELKGEVVVMMMVLVMVIIDVMEAEWKLRE